MRAVGNLLAMKLFQRNTTVTPPDDLPGGDLLRPAPASEIIKQIDELLKRAEYLERHSPDVVDALLDYRNRLSARL